MDVVDILEKISTVWILLSCCIYFSVKRASTKQLWRRITLLSAGVAIAIPFILRIIEILRETFRTLDIFNLLFLVVLGSAICLVIRVIRGRV